MAEILSKLYLFFLLFFLPLYMKDGYYMLGDAKYDFFRKIAIVFLTGGFLIYPLVFFYRHKQNKNYQNSEKFGKRPPKKQKKYVHEKDIIVINRRLCVTDYFVIGFAAVSFISFCFSDYRECAWNGFDDWHMGLLTQLLMAGGYFLIRFGTSDLEFAIKTAAAASFIVSLTTVINRCGDDPFELYQEMDWFSWNRRNLLSTIGNINWVCAYLAITVPILLYCFWSAKGKKRIIAFIGAFNGTAAIMLQGSMTGYLDLLFFMGILLWISVDSLKKIVCFLDTLILIPLFWTIFSLFQIDLILPFDMNMKEVFYSPFWTIPLLILILLDAAIRIYIKHERMKNEKALKSAAVIRLMLVGSVAACIIIFALCQISDDVWNFFGAKSILKFDTEWGSYRGGLWLESIKGFFQMNALKKLFGIGPDCFAFLMQQIDLTLNQQGQWQDVIYANAHNEWISMLINEGIFGMLCYLGIFISAAVRCIRNKAFVPGLLIIAGYLVNNTFAFQQVVSTPQIFVMLPLLAYAGQTKDS